MPGRRARSPIAVYARVQCREPKTGQEKVQFCCEDDLLAYYEYVTIKSGTGCNLQYTKLHWPPTKSMY